MLARGTRSREAAGRAGSLFCDLIISKFLIKICAKGGMEGKFDRLYCVLLLRCEK